MRKAVCTICSNNYLHFARTLMGSLRETQPDWDQVVLICDEVRGVFDPAAEPFRVIELAELDIPDRPAFCFRYTILELNTAVKPWLLEYLFTGAGTGVPRYDQVVYMDPDIFVYKPLAEVEALLDEGNFAVLTPHLTGRLDDDAKPSELEILRAGSYNLGFLALRRAEQTMSFLSWWQEKVEFDCVVDFEHGLFVDQKWMELAPGMFGSMATLRHEGYNVAYWNLKHRHASVRDEKFFFNDDPLVFFHFSGLNPEKPGPFSKHQDRFRMGNLGLVRRLVRRYIAAVKDNGLAACKTWPYAFGTFTDGEPVMDVMRAYYRKHLELEGAVKGDPFEMGHDYWHRPWGDPGPDDAVVTLLMRAIWESRRDFREHFPDLDVASRWDYAYWFAEVIAPEFNLPGCCVSLIRRSLVRPGVEPEVAPADADAKAPRVKIRRPPGESRLRRIARRVLPRPLKRWIKSLMTPEAGSTSRHRRFVRKLSHVLPRSLRQRLRSAVNPTPAEAMPGREHVRVPIRAALGTYYMGFFDRPECLDGDGTVWMGTEGGVRILKPRAATLRITGFYVPEYFVRAAGSPELNLALSLDGKHLGDIHLVHHGIFEGTARLPEPESFRYAMLTIEADRHFVPEEIGLGKDQRKLTVKVARIELDEMTLLDFSRCPDAYMPDGGIEHDELGLNIVGYLQSELGVGESARLCTASADAAGVAYSLINFDIGCTSRNGDARLARHITNTNPHRVNLFHINADQMPTVFSCLGGDFFRDRYNIGFWHWELPEFPDAWLDSFACLQEVWTPSRFVSEAVAAKSPVPVVRMGHAVRIDVPPDLSRASMGLPEDRFLFLMMYDMHSFQGRKNPHAGLEAFRRAFGRDRSGDVALVLKTMNTDTYPDEWKALEEELEKLGGVVIINETLTRQEVYNLEALSDCFLSLHRSEGFGLGLAESMVLGKPVIGTNWSGNVDFMNEKNSCPVDYQLVKITEDVGPYKRGQVWADADVDHAAWYMRKLVEDPDYRERIAAAGRHTIRTDFNHETIGRRYRDRLKVIARLM